MMEYNINGQTHIFVNSILLNQINTIIIKKTLKF